MWEKLARVNVREALGRLGRLSVNATQHQPSFSPQYQQGSRTELCVTTRREEHLQNLTKWPLYFKMISTPNRWVVACRWMMPFGRVSMCDICERPRLCSSASLLSFENWLTRFCTQSYQQGALSSRFTAMECQHGHSRARSRQKMKAGTQLRYSQRYEGHNATN